MALDPVRNHAIVTVSAGHTISETSIALASGHGAYLPDPATEGAFNLVWWNSTDYKNPSLDPLKEIIRVTGRSGDTLTVVRPAGGNSYNGEGSDNTAHAKNITGRIYKMVLTPTRKYIEDFQDELNRRAPIVTVGFSDATYVVDGTADDVQIQQALDYVHSIGGGKVHVNGYSTDYDITAALSTYDDVIFEGDGSATVLKANASLSGTINMIENDDTVGGNSNCIVRDMKIDGNQSARSGSYGGETGHCVMFMNSTKCLALNLDIINAYSTGVCFAQGTSRSLMHNVNVVGSKYHCLMITGDSGGATSHDNTMSACTVSGAGLGATFGTGLEIANYAVRNTIINCNSTGALESGLNIYYNSTHNKVVGCTLHENTQNGISIVDVSDFNTISSNDIYGNTRVGIAFTTSILTYGGKNVVIADNMITSNGMNGIRGNALDKCIIRGNKIDSNGAGGTSTLQYGVYVGSAADLVFQGNDVSNSTNRGIDMTDVSNMTCTGNKSRSNGTVGMQVNYVSVGCIDSVISGNEFTSNTTIGLIMLQGATRVTFANNICRGNTTSGMELRGATDCEAIGNICSGNGTIGMRAINDASAVGTTGCTFIGNRCTGNTTGGFSETGAADNNIIVGNNFLGNTTANFAFVGANDVVSNNIGVNPIRRYAQGNVTGATTFTRVNGSTIYATLTGNITVTLTNGVVVGDELVLVLTQDGTGSRTVTWPGTAKFAHGNALALSTTAAAVDVITLSWDGTNWREKTRAIYDQIASGSEVDTGTDNAKFITPKALADSGYATEAYAQSLFAANDALLYKGVIDCSGNPNYPAADAGHVYKISVAGKIGGASGVVVTAGDTVLCTVDGSASGDQAAVGANWDVIQANLDKATGAEVDTGTDDVKFVTAKAIADSTAVLTTKTQTLTNKRITARVVAMADATSFTPTGDTADINTQENTQAVGTLTANAPSGTPTHGQRLMLEITSTNVQTFSWNAIYRSSNDVVLPTASTGSSKMDRILFIYNATASKWDIVAKSLGY